VAATVGGLFTDSFGYVAVFTTAAALTLLALVPAMLFFRRAGAGAELAENHGISAAAAQAYTGDRR
jgi:predicted MFS family arabinose efflux permease